MAKLAAYVAKRDFDKTAEPRGGAVEAAGAAFVIQKHDATRLHYDLRLELDGVMLSWAVTRGPSLVAGEKRLAVHVEDHPVAYNTFEGTIPKGQYGGGTVLIWDRGAWAPEQDPRRGMAKGHLEFRLDGEKLHGRFHLVRLKPRARERQESWLLIKAEDEFARAAGEPDILEELPLSVASGRSLDEIASEKGGEVWNSDRGEAAQARAAKTSRSARRPGRPSPPPEGEASGAKRLTEGDTPAGQSPARFAPRATRPFRPGREKRPDLVRDGREAEMPTEIAPCLATLVADVPQRGAWLHEIKWDGYRLVAFTTVRKAKLATRRGLDWTQRFPGIAEAIAALDVGTAILDGEAVVEGENGVASFSALQNALSDAHGQIARNAIFYAFDLLYLDGFDLRHLPLADRKARLAALVPAGAGVLRLSEHLETDGKAMLRSARELGLEGIVSKRADRPYRSGRSDDWVKVKCVEQQEFIVAGYVPSSVSPRAVGSLVLGYNEDGRLRHAGRSGTGFTAQSSREIWKRLDAIRRKTSPFRDKLATEERRNVVWVEPGLVAEIAFAGWTADAHLRHAAFKGLREDKDPAEIVRERPADPAAAGAAGSGGRPYGVRKAKPRGAGEVAGVPLTHPDRVLWDEGITKQDLAEYYEGIADWVLPHLAGRPLSLVRCPNGASHGCFFQKHSWAGAGVDIRRATVRDEGGEEEVLFIEDIRGLVSLVQAGVLEIHPWGSVMADVEHPDRITMDLDPAEDVPFAAVAGAARDVRERLAAVGLDSFVKTTGGKGLHVVVPLTPKAGWDEVKGFAHALALAMEADDPRRYIAKASKQARRGLIYVDYLRNGRGATAIGAYSTRARAGATLSVPVGWEELDAGLKPNGLTIRNLRDRLDQLGADPWAEIGRVRQHLPVVGGRARRAGTRQSGGR